MKTIIAHTKGVTSLLLMKNGIVVSCSWDRTIRIYEPSNHYHYAQVIERYSSGIYSICELDVDIIVSCLWDKSIMII